MKRFLIIALVLLFVFVCIFVVKNTQTSIASAETFSSGYAKVLSNDCYLRKEPTEDSRLFLLEQSYFVKVLSDEDKLYYKVQYLDFEGFVEKSKLSFVEEFPNQPYLIGITFDIYDLGNVCMRSSPETLDSDSNILCTIKMSTKDITFYGKCTGEEALNGLGNIWYFAGYQDEYGNLYKGYVYSPLTRNLSAITSSTENLTLVSTTSFLPVDNLLYLNISTRNMLIVITAIPTLFVIYLFAKPTRIIEKNRDD